MQVTEIGSSTDDSHQPDSHQPPQRLQVYRRTDRSSLDDAMSPPDFPPGILERFDLSDMALGQQTATLFQHPGSEGYSIVWARFAPHFILPRHTHSTDCLYHFLSGTAILGSQVLTAGEGFFVPAGQPYSYRAGDQGVEVLEFRHATSFDMKIVEASPQRWQHMIDNAREHRELWATSAPASPSPAPVP